VILLSFILPLTYYKYQNAIFVILMLQDYTTLLCVCVFFCVWLVSFLQKEIGAVVKEGAAEMTYAPADCALETCNYLVPLQLPS